MKWIKNNWLTLLAVLIIPVIAWAVLLHVRTAVLADDVEELDVQVVKVESIKECMAEQATEIAVIKSGVENIEEDVDEIKALIKSAACIHTTKAPTQFKGSPHK